MNFVYLTILQAVTSMIASKIQNDTMDKQTRMNLIDAVEASWKKVQAAHVALQTSSAAQGDNK